MSAPRKAAVLLGQLRQRLGRIGDRRREPPPARPNSARPVKPAEHPPPVSEQHTAEAFLSLVGGLVRRPAGSDRGLPLVWLIGSKHTVQVLKALEQRFEASTRYGVPFARLSVNKPVNKTASNESLRTLLHAACAELAKQRHGAARIWFRHLGLVTWLMEQDLSRFAPDDSPVRLQALLYERHRKPGADDPGEGARATAGDAGAVGSWYHMLFLLVRRAVPKMLFRAVISGRIPGLGRPYRWFMRQQYLAPQQSRNFLGFAERLTNGVWQTENPEQVERLLVHSFLEDLRWAYARRPWRVEGWRRTAYPVLLIDNVERGTNGYRLLQLINDVRNETGRSDPLLAICTSDDGPPAADDGGRGVVATRFGRTEPSSDEQQLRRADPTYKRWAESLPGSRRARVRTAWNLALAVPDAGRAHDIPFQTIHVPRPPWFARRAVPIAVVMVLVAAMAGWVGWQAGWPGCQHRPFSGEISLRSVNGECIGYSDNAGYLFDDEPGQEALRTVQQTIFEQNQAAVDRRSRNERRPLVTIVYLGALTGRATTPEEEAHAAEREELEGLAVAQHNSLRAPAEADDVALLRIVIANGGKQMANADLAVEMIAELARRDPTVVAVVGLVDSRQNTARALERLNQAQLPVIAPTLSADRMFEWSSLYLQLVPANQMQANMLKQYAQNELGVSKVRIYYTTGEGNPELEEDLYVKTLVDGLKTEFRDQLEEDVKRFDGQSLAAECAYDGMLLFAGRWSEFDRFVRGLRVCNDNPPVHLVADDSVNRYMANTALRENAPNNLSLTFVSKAHFGSCASLQQAINDQARSQFLSLVQEPDLLEPPRCTGDSPVPVGERVPLAYDAATLVTEAAEQLAARLRVGDQQPWDPRSINPATLFIEILGHHESNPFRGVSGDIKFDRNTGEPKDKRISLLKVNQISDVRVPIDEVFRCGAARTGEKTDCQRPGSFTPGG